MTSNEWTLLLFKPLIGLDRSNALKRENLLYIERRFGFANVQFSFALANWNS